MCVKFTARDDMLYRILFSVQVTASNYCSLQSPSAGSYSRSNDSLCSALRQLYLNLQLLPVRPTHITEIQYIFINRCSAPEFFSNSRCIADPSVSLFSGAQSHTHKEFHSIKACSLAFSASSSFCRQPGTLKI